MAGVIYGAYRTSWFRRPMQFSPLDNNDDK